MRAGLRRRVALAAPVRVETSGGGADIAFAGAGAVWAGSFAPL